VGVVCLRCNGSGTQDLTYAPFVERLRRGDVMTVRRSRGTFIGTGVGPSGGSITYAEFLAGKMP
jgi:hypothetical protein